MADKKFDPESLQQGIESFLGKAADVISRGREEILKQSKIGKVKLFDLMQLRRERARLVQRLGEEAYRGMQAGKLEKDDLKRTYQRIVEMDEQIAKKEAEIERLQKTEGAGTARPGASSPSQKTGASRKADTGAKPAAKKPPMDTKPKKRMGQEESSDDGEE